MPSSITLTVSHLPTSTSFFLSALQPLGYVFRGRQEHTIGFGLQYPPNTPADFWITQEIPDVPAGAAHVAFPAASRTQVQDFFLAALKAGGQIHGEPCQRDATGYYSAAVIDFDGNSIEAVHRPTDEANKEKVDIRTMVSHRGLAPPKSVVSQAKSKAPSAIAPPQSAFSQAESKAASYVSGVLANTPRTEAKRKSSGDVLDTLINEARNAANVARDLVSTFKGNLSSSQPSARSNNTPVGGGEAIVGTLLGVAAGAALHYAFSNRSKESSRSDDDSDVHKFQARRPFVTGRSLTEPAKMRSEYSSVPSEYHRGYYAGDGYQRAIEPAPSAYTCVGQRRITMHDHEPPAPTAITYRTSPRSEYASTIRPATATRRMSIDSGFGPGPRDIEVASHASSKTSRQSKPPPTSYRVPTVLTEKLSKVSSAKGDGPRSRASSLNRAGRTSSQSGREEPRSRSQSRHSTHSRRSRRDDIRVVQREIGEAQTVLHVTESLHRSTTYPAPGVDSKGDSPNPSRTSSKHSSRARAPAAYPLPPSRAATWAGSDSGKTFMSVRSNLGPNGRVDAPRTVIGRSNPLRSAGTVEKADTASVVSKQKDLRHLDVTDREVGPEDSVSQISVDSRRTRRTKTSSRR